MLQDRSGKKAKKRASKAVGFLPPAFALCCWLCGCAKTSTVVIYYTGDTRGQLWSRPAKEKGGKEIGGLAVLKRLVDSEKKPHLLLDTGEWLHGTLEEGLVKGNAVVECMNETGYDAVSVGSGEFAFGYASLERILNDAKFRVLASNLLDSQKNKMPVFAAPYVIEDAGGFKIGIFGLSGSRTPKRNLPEHVAGLRFRKEAESAAEAVKALKKKGAGVIIALSRADAAEGENPGADANLLLARAVPGIDVIIGGSKRGVSAPVISGRTWILNSAAGLTHAGRIELGINPSGTLGKLRAGFILLDKEVLGEDPRIAGLAASYRKALSVKLDRKIGTSGAALENLSAGESPVGDWVADCMRKWGKSDAAVIDSAYIKSGIGQGAVTLRSLYELMPFDSTVVMVKIRGEDLLQALEGGLSERGETLQISGVRVVYDPSGQQGKKIRDVYVGGVPLSPNRVYRLAAPDFMLAAGDGHGVLSNAVEFVNTRRFVREILGWCVGRERALLVPESGRWIKQ